MDLDDLDPKRPVRGQKPLDSLGVAELEHYIADLTAEIERAKAAIAARQASRAGAEAFFRK